MVMEQQIKEMFVATYGLDVPPDQVPSDAELFGPGSAYGLDSMDVLQFIAKLHERFTLDIGGARTDTFLNVRNIVRFLEA
jgi:acyl carrier protein